MARKSAQNSGETATSQRGTAKQQRGRPFQPGQSGNPGGRPQGLARRIRQEVGDDGGELVAAMLGILRAETSTARERIDAATWLADRGFGRPKQALELMGAEAGPIEVRLSFDPDA